MPPRCMASGDFSTEDYQAAVDFLSVQKNVDPESNKYFVSIPGAVHTDLYDRKDIIPFDKMTEFFNKYLV